VLVLQIVQKRNQNKKNVSVSRVPPEKLSVFEKRLDQINATVLFEFSLRLSQNEREKRQN